MTSPLARTGQNAGTLTTAAPVSPFDMPAGLAQQGATFTFDLVDGASGQLQTRLQPIADTVPQLTHDTTRTTKRQLTLALDAADTAQVDTIHDRIRVAMRLASGVSYPLGTYLFTDNTRLLYTSGRQSSAILMDTMFILDQPRDTGFPGLATSMGTASTGAIPSCSALIAELLQDFPTVVATLEASPFSTNNSWSLGTTSGQVLADLATFGDYFPPWFDSANVLRVIRSFDPLDRVPTLDWDTYDHVYADTITETDDLLTAPNRIVVVSNDVSDATAQGSIVGTYDIPSSAPHSIQNRGFVVPSILNIQVNSPAQATAMAANIGQQRTLYQRTGVSTFPDPRHDSYDVIRWQGENWLELSWTMDLIEGGTMTHTLRKAYR